MKKFLSGFLGVCIGCIAADCHGAILATWSFETSIPANAGPHAPEVGTGEASFIAGGATANVFSNPAGNGSLESFSSNGWDAGEGFQFRTSTVGFDSINIAWDQTGSNTGPRDFIVQHSDDGITFTNFGSVYALPSPAVGWSTTVPNALGNTSFTADFSSIAALNNAPTAFFRLIQQGTVSINAGIVASGGTGRVDNFVVNGTAIAVPEPTSMALIGVVGVTGLAVRYRRKNASSSVAV